MKIVLTGVETNNKGAELMLYAILQEIERRHPHAKVFISKDRVSCGIDSIITSLDLRCIPMRELEKKCHLDGIYRVLHLPYKIMPHKISLGKVDYYLDGSGFRYSDQFLMPFKYISQVEEQLRTLKNEGTRVVLLPQAFGPFEKAESKKMISVLSDNASVIMPREKVSLEYLKKTGVVDMSKV
nr:polysaccharide pyruvyl transferase family protein [Eubacterium sp.]